MNVLSLFDGMSCGMLALDRLGIKVDKYYASEIDKYAMKVSKANYPKIVQMGDITKLDLSTLPKIDLVMGGSPCQGFSFSGKGLAFDDPRSVLFFEFHKVISYLHPKYFLLENVRMKKEYLDIISEYMGVEPIFINSSLVSAQSRQRYYWTNIPNISQPKDKNIVLKDILEFEPRNFTKVVCAAYRGRYNEDGSISQRLELRKDNKTNSITTVQKDNVLTKDEVYWRKLTPLEAERLQTVPDNYTNHVSNSQRFKMLGNGWTIEVIAHILKNMEIEQ